MTFPAERAAREERANLIETTKPTIEKLERGDRLTVEERTELDGKHKRIAELNAEVRTYEEARAASEAASREVGAAPAPELTNAEARERDFSAFLKRGSISPEVRAAGEASGSTGGYLVPPGWWQRLQVAMKVFGGIASDFEQLETESGQPMNWATVNPTAVVGTLLAENAQVSNVDYAFGQGTLGAYMYTSNAQLVSIQLANDSAFDIDTFIQNRVGESIGRAKAAVAISGTGSAQPLGINTALAATSSTGTVGTGSISPNGGFLTLGTAGSINLGGTATTELLSNTLNQNTLRSMIASVDPAYRGMGAKFYMNDNQLLGLRGQTDSTGRALINLQDGITPGSPGSVWGYDIKVDQNIPNLTASTAGGPIFGHLGSAMVCRTVNQAGLLRLNERYADFLQIGFIGYVRFDIRANDLRAAVVVKAAAT